MSNINTQIQARRSVFARIQATLSRIARDRRGATTVEYLVLVAFIALAGIAAVQGLSGKIGSAANKVGGNVESLTPWGGK